MTSNDSTDWKGRYYELLTTFNDAELDAENRLKLFAALTRKLAQFLSMQEPEASRWTKLTKVMQNVPETAELNQWVDKLEVPVMSGTMPLVDDALPPVAKAAIETSDETPLALRLRDWLLEQVQPVMHELKEHVGLESLITTLRSEASADVVEKTLQSLLKVLFEQLGQQNRELVGYLQDLNRHLEVVQRFVDAEKVHQSVQTQDATAFTAQLTEGVVELRQEVREATRLDALQQQVESRLQSLSSQVERYRSASEKRADHWQKRYAEMEKRMASLKTEHRRLQNQFENQHQRMQADPLTGLPNRLAYDLRLAELFGVHRAKGGGFVLVVADIDHFKSINDQYGHLAGDKVLKIVARTLKPLLRKEDMLARVGGEEFVFMLPGMDLEQGRIFAERVREASGSVGFHFRGKSVTITVSLGVAVCQAQDTASSLFDRADQALYQAKRNGRNQVCVASTDNTTRKR